jgi:hypothetical protein
MIDIRSAKLVPSAIALLDILGARGVLGDAATGDFLVTMQLVWYRLEQLRKCFGSPKTVKTAFFSDTLLVCVSGEASPGGLVDTAAELASAAIHTAMTLPRPFTYRGCISVGDVAMVDAFCVGPAINEAAELYEQAEAGVVWLAPSALEHASARVELPAATVPLKGGRTIDSLFVNPLLRTWKGGETCDGGSSRTAEDKHADATFVRDSMLRTFDTRRLDVAIKKQNTRRLLDLALQVCAADEQRLASELRRSWEDE